MENEQIKDFLKASEKISKCGLTAIEFGKLINKASENVRIFNYKMQQNSLKTKK